MPSSSTRSRHSAYNFELPVSSSMVPAYSRVARTSHNTGRHVFTYSLYTYKRSISVFSVHSASTVLSMSGSQTSVHQSGRFPNKLLVQSRAGICSHLSIRSLSQSVVLFHQHFIVSKHLHHSRIIVLVELGVVIIRTIIHFWVMIHNFMRRRTIYHRRTG